MKQTEDAAGGRDLPLEYVRKVPLGQIRRHPLNREISQADAQEMADDLKAHGQIMPAILRPMEGGSWFQLIVGERRWKGCELAGIPDLLSIVREMSDTEAARVLLIENLKRRNLTEIEEAQTYDRLLQLRDENGARIYTIEQIAIEVHADKKDVARVARIHKLLQLPAAMIKAVEEKTVPSTVAFLVARIADKSARERAAKEVMHDKFKLRPMTGDEAKKHISEHYQNSLKNVSFNRHDPTLVDEIIDKGGERIAGGECDSCPSLAKNNPAFRDQLASGKGNASMAGTGESGIDPMTCVSPHCFHLKIERTWERITAEIIAAEPELKHVPINESKHWFPYDTERVNVNVPVIGIEEKPEIYKDKQLVDLPKWSKVLKGSGIEVQLACGPDMTPVRVADKELAMEWLQQQRPELFSATGLVKLTEKEIAKLQVESASTGVTMAELTEKAEKRKADDEARKAKLEKLIESEAKRDTISDLFEKVWKKGLALDAWPVVFAASATHVDEWDSFAIFLGIENKKGLAIDDFSKWAADKPMPQVIAATVCALVWDDFTHSGARALHFSQLAKMYGVSHEETLARVKKAHEMAEKQRLAEEAAKEKEAAQKPHKNSSDPNDWSADGEAAKTAAADERAKSKKREQKPRIADKDVEQGAKGVYMATGSITEAAEAVGVTVNTVRKWHQRRGWKSERDKALKAAKGK